MHLFKFFIIHAPIIIEIIIGRFQEFLCFFDNNRIAFRASFFRNKKFTSCQNRNQNQRMHLNTSIPLSKILTQNEEVKYYNEIFERN